MLRMLVLIFLTLNLIDSKYFLVETEDSADSKNALSPAAGPGVASVEVVNEESVAQDYKQKVN